MNMENKFKLKLAGRDLVVEVKTPAEQANGSALVSYGDTVVLATAVMSKQEKAEADFFPLTVDYEERFYAAGKILGARYIRREGRPTDEAVLTSRLIDRAIRPLFPPNLYREVQIIITCLSWDGENDPDVLGLLGASCSLLISDIPWGGPVAAVRIGMKDRKEFILNPTYKERGKTNGELSEPATLDLILTGVSSSPLGGKGPCLINMMEAEADEIPEAAFLEAVSFSEPTLKKLIDFQEEIRKKAGKEKVVLGEGAVIGSELDREIKEFLGGRLEQALFQKEKQEKVEAVNELREELICELGDKYPAAGGKISYAKKFFDKEIEGLVHFNILESEKRPDGRKLDEIRKLHIEAGVLPRTHGSCLFCRGTTKSLSILTLGAPGDQRLLEGMEIVGKKRFMHHYNFPPYSVGEIKPLRGPARRDIGHGMLAEKALMPVVPSFEEFPYTMRAVSEILSSNGSSSMASSCGISLALMDAGVPIKRPVAGIALGLMTRNTDNYKILTDIQGPEDHYGDMDFKVAGTKEGITAIQMDVKIRGINEKILGDALKQGRQARLQILEEMERVLAQPRKELSPYAPRILTIQINPDKIREVVGPGGKVINEIIEECKVDIDIQPSGLIFITSDKEEAAKKALAWIKNITREIKAGETFQGKVKRILDFGAFVEVMPKQEGLVHISELAPYRVRRVEDVVKIGDIVSVKVISVDEQGRINLSMKNQP